MDDRSLAVRDASYFAFATLSVILSPSTVHDFYSKLDKHKQKKIDDCIPLVKLNRVPVKQPLAEKVTPDSSCKLFHQFRLTL